MKYYFIVYDSFGCAQHNKNNNIWFVQLWVCRQGSIISLDISKWMEVIFLDFVCCELWGIDQRSKGGFNNSSKYSWSSQNFMLAIEIECFDSPKNFYDL